MKDYQSIIDEYKQGTTIKEIAKKLGISEVKTRRILITEGLWHSKTSDEIAALASQDLNASQIAKKLDRPVKTVQAYMPYSRGEYMTGEMSENAKRAKDFRDRNKNIKGRQVNMSNKEVNSLNKITVEKPAVVIDLGEWKKDSGFIGEGKKVYKLHMQLQMDLNDKEEAILAKYGKSKKGISRDILVPEDMMLHNLHYAIMKAFGWQNSHLHDFKYPEEIYKQLVGTKFLEWANYCGLYFRYPDSENSDNFWDDDYEESMSFKTWLRKKYTGPFIYEGYTEHYMYAQTQARTFVQQNPMLNIGPSFEEYMAGKKERKLKKIEDLTNKEMNEYFESSMSELLERLTIKQVIGLKATENWEQKVKEIIVKANSSFAENYSKLNKARKARNYDLETEYYKNSDFDVIPLSDTLVYSYDYGDGWEVDISCDEIYEVFDSWNKPSTTGYIRAKVTDEQILADQHPFDSSGHSIEGELRDQIAKVAVCKKPVCIAADGLPVFDDVGGPRGYVYFLNGIHGEDCGPYEYGDKAGTKRWAKWLGWTGTLNKPENIL